MAAPLPLPALHATHAGIWIAGGDGEVREASRGEAIARAAETPHIILNAPLVGQRLGYPELSGLDLLELFAFIHPARFAVPTVAGLSRALGLGAAGQAMPRRQPRCRRSRTGLLGTLERSRLAGARRRLDRRAIAASAGLGLGAAGRRAAGTARARRAHALLAAEAVGRGGGARRRRGRSVDPALTRARSSTG